jgi:SurA N-terminal domain
VVSPRLRGAAVAVLCAVALSSCGPAHPGAAAQVGDVSISDETLQQNTDGFCELINTINRAQQGTTPPVPLRTALLSALNTLVMGEALDQVAARNHVTVTQAEVQRWVGSLPFDLSDVPQARRAETQAVIQRVGRNTLLLDRLGRQAYQRQNPGSTAAPSNQVQRLAQQQVNQYMQRVGVDTDPRYGQVTDTSSVPGTGSLSVAVSEEGIDAENVPDPNSDLPPGQACA